MSTNDSPTINYYVCCKEVPLDASFTPRELSTSSISVDWSAISAS